MLICSYFMPSASNQLRSAACQHPMACIFYQINNCKDQNWINVLGVPGKLKATASWAKSTYGCDLSFAASVRDRGQEMKQLPAKEERSEFV